MSFHLELTDQLRGAWRRGSIEPKQKVQGPNWAEKKNSGAQEVPAKKFEGLRNPYPLFLMSCV